MIRKFVETPEFRKCCQKHKISDAHIRALQDELLSNPKKGDLIVGSGGTRKARVRSSYKGKSGSFRVFYTDYSTYGIIFFWIIIDKKEAANITTKEKLFIKKMNELMKKELRRYKI